MVKFNNLSTQKTVLIVKPFEAGAGAGNDSGLQLLLRLLLLRQRLLSLRVDVDYYGVLLNDRLLVNDLLVEGCGNFVASGVKVAELLLLPLDLWHEVQLGRFFDHLLDRLLLEQLFRRLVQDVEHRVQGGGCRYGGGWPQDDWLWLWLWLRLGFGLGRLRGLPDNDLDVASGRLDRFVVHQLFCLRCY